jgi:phospholipase C
MGFFTPEDVPITTFLANEFAVCDHWFASLPTSTQPNRIMSLCGTTRIDETHGIFPPRDAMVLDWLSNNGVRWRVYHSGISFFALLGRGDIFGANFRGIDRLAADVAHEQARDFPQVIFVEPSYGDAPHIGGDVPNDNHAPLAVAPGEALLLRVYQALTVNPQRWARTVFVVTYDEHGGFFDHVPPPLVPYAPAPNATFQTPFASLGVRVPGLVVSPLVRRQTVHKGVLDHTSFLQLLAEKFTPGTVYSKPVDDRQRAGVESASAALNLSAPRGDIPTPPKAPLRATVSLSEPQSETLTDLQDAFRQAARRMVADAPKQTAQMYPEVSHWVLTQEVSEDVG